MQLQFMWCPLVNVLSKRDLKSFLNGFEFYNVYIKLKFGKFVHCCTEDVI